MSHLPILYNCERCPAYCCSYPSITVRERDIGRLAKHLDLSTAAVKRTLTKRGTEGQRVLRHKWDDVFGTVCRLLDRESRKCTVYQARPLICRQFPGTPRCGYYDFLSFERRTSGDPEQIAVTYQR